MHNFSVQAPTRRNLIRLWLSTALAVVTMALLPTDAGVAMPAIEGFPTYHPQTTCSPTPKPGTVMLANYLMRHYRGSGSLGISRSCAASGVSEHKEGRAFDWALSVGSRRDRGYAADFLRRLRKTDRFGHRDALARRMGIMYVIWNDHIYSATYHYRKRRYLAAGCRSIRTCSVTLRHRNHMHISLTWAGALAKDSWYVARRAGHHAGHAAHRVHHRRHHAVHHRRHHPVHHRVHHRHRHAAPHHRSHRAHHRGHHRHRHAAPHRRSHRRHHAVHHRVHNRVHHRAHHRAHHRRHHAVHHRGHRRTHHRHRHAARNRAFSPAHRQVTAQQTFGAAAPDRGAQWTRTSAAPTSEEWPNLVDSAEDEVDLPRTH